MFTCRFDKDDHPLFIDEPLDELDEGGDDSGVPHLLDHQHRQRGLIPCEPLGGGILDCPVWGTKKIEKKNFF